MTLANQKTIATNGDGYAVLPFATAYHRNDVSLDSHSLPENVDLANSTVTLVPTKDAVVLARFHTHVGYKALFTLQSRDNRCPLAAKYALRTPTASLPARVRCTWPAWRQKAPCMRNGGQALSSAVAPATISPRRWRRPPIHSSYSRRYHVLFNSPASGRPDAVIYSVTGRQRMGLYASVCPRPGLPPSAERGQLTVPADARPGTPLYHKSFAWNRLSDGGEQWIRCADDPHGLSPLLLDSLLSGE